ncbi:DUF1289 domain-containing protein [Falsochrobactrum ovis]|uniref:DUF1289 domain-containing protein n=1 Tax=Falsochrobactrum ovis TaxID=1293442 RepID=UPI000DB93803|nr:DUF1289 domain-containing protein [Falsochrobactrum ovis]
MNKKAIESPCIMVCVIDHRTGLCLGCARSLDEIGRWSAMSDQEQLSVLATLSERHKQLKKKEG